jgi:ADP-ribose pyrophosphatase YjhB (NUDIX family)
MSTPSELPRRLAHIRKIAAIAQAGLTYSTGPFDRERYEVLQRLAEEMLSELSDVDPAITKSIFESENGYTTPKVDVRAAVFKDGKILLVKERSDGLWTLPGGWADVNESPSEAVEKEVREEAGYEVKATRLMAVLDRDRHGAPPLLWHVYKLFFECKLIGGERIQSSIETDGVEFFGPDAIPSLSLTRVMPSQIERLFVLHQNPGMPADFD